MTTAPKKTTPRRMLSLLQLSQELGNVSKACRSMGYSREQFDVIRSNFHNYGADGLTDLLRDTKESPPDLVAEDSEDPAHASSLEHPSHVAPDGADDREGKSIQTKEPSQIPERSSHGFEGHQVEARFPADVVAVDTLALGSVEGIGTVHLQIVLDHFSRMAWAHFYTSTLPVTAVHVLNNRVLPFLDEHCIRIGTILSDNSMVFCGQPDAHPYEIFLQLEEIEHRTTTHGVPRANGVVQQFHRTLLDEHLHVRGRGTAKYGSLDEMQARLDEYLLFYNTQRPHPGREARGMTPLVIFQAGLSEAVKGASSPPHPAEDEKAH